MSIHKKASPVSRGFPCFPIAICGSYFTPFPLIRQDLTQTKFFLSEDKEKERKRHMKGYRHLTLHDRFRIEKMLCNQCSKTEIANALHVNVSTISREVKRGSCTYTNNDGTEVHKYIPEWSHARYRQHLEAKGRRLKIYLNLDWIHLCWIFQRR